MSPEPVPYRKRVRAEGYDYTQPGWYFVTVCTQGRRCLFGSIDSGTLSFSPAGEMVEQHLQYLPRQFRNVDIDGYVVMPNHIHVVIILYPVDDASEAASLSDVVAAFKRMTTNAYIKRVREAGWTPFPGRLWQRSFHDKIIRSDRHLDQLRTYIESNPFLWPKDTYYTNRNEEKAAPSPS